MFVELSASRHGYMHIACLCIYISSFWKVNFILGKLGVKRWSNNLVQIYYCVADRDQIDYQVDCPNDINIKKNSNFIISQSISLISLELMNNYQSALNETFLKVTRSHSTFMQLSVFLNHQPVVFIRIDLRPFLYHIYLFIYIRVLRLYICIGMLKISILSRLELSLSLVWDFFSRPLVAIKVMVPYGKK